MEVLGDFAFDGIMEENSVGLVRMGDFLLLLSGGGWVPVECSTSRWCVHARR